jgi:hypothetical protein
VRVLTLTLVLLSSLASASPVRVDVSEKSTGLTTSYSFDVTSSTLRKSETVSTKDIPQASVYSVVDRKLVARGFAVSAADDILYQCPIDGFDVVVVRAEHNSFSNPFRVLVAFSGHPIQVSTIYILKIKDHVVVSRQEVIHKPASYEWSAKVSQ